MVRKLTTKEIKERIYSLEGDNYKLLSEYVNAKTKIKIKHVVCGHEFETNWSNFQTGRRCPKCATLDRKNKLAFTNEDIVKAMYVLVGDEYTKMDDTYINAQTKFRMRHNTCGCEFEVNWANFSMDSRCPKCAMLARKNKLALANEEIVQRMYELVGSEYTKLDNVYINAHTKFKIRHETCKHVYEVSWNAFQKGKRCPCCNQSKGEKFIEDYLTNQGISFATQVRFIDCRYKKPLPFDFAILNSENEVAFLIEYDGRQHFEPIEIWGGEENLKEVQLRDRIKDSYCKKNNIPLLRIRYDEQNMLKVIEEFLAQETERKV